MVLLQLQLCSGGMVPIAYVQEGVPSWGAISTKHFLIFFTAYPPGTACESQNSHAERKARKLCLQRLKPGMKPRGCWQGPLPGLVSPGLSQLLELDLSYCNLEEVPEFLGEMGCLQRMSLAGNALLENTSFSACCWRAMAGSLQVGQARSWSVLFLGLDIARWFRLSIVKKNCIFRIG